ncbi:MAG: hypothetical protein ACP5KX_07330 [Caldisericia bacterium]
MDEKEKQKNEIIMKDYEILKTYSTITSPSIRYNIISFALATIGIIISGILFALSYKESSYLLIITIILFTTLFIPAFTLVILFIWLGEEERMIRIGYYCKKLEEKINNKFNEDILNWEKFIRKKEERIIYPEILIIGLFLGIGYGFVIYGLMLAKIYLNFDKFYFVISFSKLNAFYFCLIISSSFYLIISLLIYFKIYKNKFAKN